MRALQKSGKSKLYKEGKGMNAIYLTLHEYSTKVKGFSREGKIILIATIFLGTGQGIIGLLLNLFLYHQGYTQVFIGVVTFVNSFASTLFAIPLAYAGRKFSYSRGLALAFLFLGLGNLLMVLLPSKAIILSLSFIGGIFLSWGAIAFAPLMTSSSTTDERDFLFSIQFGLSIFASSLGNYFGGLFPGAVEKFAPPPVSNPYRWSLLPGVLCFFLSSLLFFLFPEKSSFKETSKEAFHWDEKEKKSVFFICIPNFFIGLGAGFLIPFFNLFFKLQHSTSDKTLGVIFAVASLLTGVGGFLAPLFSRSLGRIPVILATQGLAIILLFPIGFSHIFPLVVFAFWFRHMLMNMNSPLWSAFSMEQVKGEKRLLANAIYLISWQGGWSITSLLSGWIQKNWGFTPLFPLTALLYLSAFVWIFFHFQKNH